MNPSRELDILVAEKVMGWTEIETRKGNATGHNIPHGIEPATVASPYTGYRPKHIVPEYSVDISATQKVFDYLISKGFRITVSLSQLGCRGIISKGDLTIFETTWLKDMPHAICIMALKAVGEIQEEGKGGWYGPYDEL